MILYQMSCEYSYFATSNSKAFVVRIQELLLQAPPTLRGKIVEHVGLGLLVSVSPNGLMLRTMSNLLQNTGIVLHYLLHALGQPL